MRRWINAFARKDIGILYYINGSIKCRTLDIVMPYITHLGSAAFSVALPLVLLIYKKNGSKELGLKMLVSLLSSHLLVEIIKRAVNRPRPWITHERINSFNIPLYNYSFPSGHTTAAFSMGVMLTLNIPAILGIFILLALVVGISRIYLGVHYPSDVLIGSIIGTSFSVMTNALMFL